jgi:hypothetical protein
MKRSIFSVHRLKESIANQNRDMKMRDVNNCSKTGVDEKQCKGSIDNNSSRNHESSRERSPAHDEEEEDGEEVIGKDTSAGGCGWGQGHSNHPGQDGSVIIIGI